MKVEELARAIAAVEYGDGHDEPFEPFVPHARAVLTRLLNVSPEMMNAPTEAQFMNGDVVGVWQAMINAILQQNPPPVEPGSAFSKVADMREIADFLEKLQPPNGDWNCPDGITLSAESPSNIASYLRAGADEIEALREGLVEAVIPLEALQLTHSTFNELSPEMRHQIGVSTAVIKALLKGTPNGQG